jgi:hypothetical protein
MDAGGLCTVTVDRETPGIRAGSVSVANNKDATCIVWTSVKQYEVTLGGV